MLLTLKCHSSTKYAQLTLRPGQLGRVGSSEWVELSLPDSQLAAEHFSIECRHPLRLICAPDCVVEQSGQPLAEMELKQGATFSAGGCRFEVNIVGPVTSWGAVQSTNVELVTSGGGDAQQAPSPQAPWWSNIDWNAIDCSTRQIELLKQLGSLREAVSKLVEQRQSSLALRLIAHLLPHVQCVGWAVKEISASLPKSNQPEHQAAGTELASVLSWLEQPTEEQRIKVSVVPAPMSPEEWLAQAVVWTGGSLAPEDSPPVAPPKSLCAIACATALQLHHASGQSSLPLEHTFNCGISQVEALVSDT